jgi:F-type H+-transporting ATPase subunit b
MEQTLHQLGELLLAAIPTVVLLLVLFGLYRVLVAGPLGRILEQRYARTEGALQQAKTDIAAAESRTAEYVQRIREARAAMFKAMESRHQLAVQARATAAAQARAASDARIKQAKQEIEQEMVAARDGLQKESERLATEIIHAILNVGAAGHAPAEGGR